MYYIFDYFFVMLVGTKNTPPQKDISQYLYVTYPIFLQYISYQKIPKKPVCVLDILCLNPVRKKLLMKRHRNSKLILFSLTLSPPDLLDKSM